MKKLSPVDIPLSEGVIADDGTMFVILPTLAALESFWKKHRAEFVYAAEGMPPLFGCETTFLRPYEWVFGRSSESVAHAFFRWGKTDIGVEYRNIREESPGLWLRWRRDLAVLRRDAISRGDWSEEFEDDYVSADTFGGWWQFVNLRSAITTTRMGKAWSGTTTILKHRKSNLVDRDRKSARNWPRRGNNSHDRISCELFSSGRVWFFDRFPGKTL